LESKRGFKSNPQANQLRDQSEEANSIEK